MNPITKLENFCKGESLTDKDFDEIFEYIRNLESANITMELEIDKLKSLLKKKDFCINNQAKTIMASQQKKMYYYWPDPFTPEGTKVENYTY
mgnify:CR=1 FL=1